MTLPHLQATEETAADQGAHRGRDWLPDGLEELEEGRAGGEGETGAGAGDKAAGLRSPLTLCTAAKRYLVISSELSPGRVSRAADCKIPACRTTGEALPH